MLVTNTVGSKRGLQKLREILRCRKQESYSEDKQFKIQTFYPQFLSFDTYQAFIKKKALYIFQTKINIISYREYLHLQNLVFDVEGFHVILVIPFWIRKRLYRKLLTFHMLTHRSFLVPHHRRHQQN